MAKPFSAFRKKDPSSAFTVWAALELSDDEAWANARPGPSWEAVAARLTAVPGVFLDDRVDARALAGDILGPHESLAGLWEVAADPDIRQALCLSLWLWASEELVAPFTPALAAGHAHTALAAAALRLAPIVPPQEWLLSAERREEAVRWILLWAGYLPEGEDLELARARWERVDSEAHNESIRAALTDHEHRLAVQRALREKAAAEAAARYTHE